MAELKPGQHVVEWAVETVAAYADCRDRVRLAADAWPKAPK